MRHVFIINPVAGRKGTTQALLDQLDRVPGLHLLNHLGGALLGVVKGLLVLTLAVLILTWFEVLPRPLVEDTVLLRWIAGIGGIY